MAQSFTAENNNNNHGSSNDLAAEETPRVPNKLQSITALARFEFEAGKGNEGTKILMVEWEDDDLARSPTGSWHVSWDGKKTVLPADEQTNEHTRRYYFLLPPGATIPPVITLTYEPPPDSASTAVKKRESIQINPLPAIFPPELGATATAAGKKGVLHTIWAKKRLQCLEKEIKEESASNPEGVALVMAIQEKEWIEANFGVGGYSASQNTTEPPLSPLNTQLSPTGTKKLTEKLKGLKLETSEKDLARRNTAASHADPNSHPLSPDEPDVAISSFQSFNNTSSSSSSSATQTTDSRQLVSHPPPEHIQAQQQQREEYASLSMNPVGDGDGLFAKALSPRSPGIPRSPFSFSSEETIPQVLQRIKG
ncbi:hypothetical protein VTO42DRAFT_5755 [Malbranchea cinnamomea]